MCFTLQAISDVCRKDFVLNTSNVSYEINVIGFTYFEQCLPMQPELYIYASIIRKCTVYL